MQRYHLSYKTRPYRREIKGSRRNFYECNDSDNSDANDAYYGENSEGELSDEVCGACTNIGQFQCNRHPILSIKQTTNYKSSLIHSGRYMFTFVLLILAFLIYDVIIDTEKNIEIATLKSDIMTKVHNQTEAIKIVTESLDQMYNSEEKTNIVNFIGSTGVGKTFMANIVKRYFHSVYEVNGPLNDFVRSNVVGMITSNDSPYKLIVADDLSIGDLDNLLSFLKQLPQDTAVFVICIFNIQETDDHLNYSINYGQIDTIVSKFNEAGIHHKVAKFHEFDKNHVNSWITKQLVMKGIDLKFHAEIIKSALLEHNCKYHGLKGLSFKLNLEML